MAATNRRTFGTMPDGTAVELLELRAGSLSCNVITYGGALQALTVPGRDGKPVDVLLGFDTLEDYLIQGKYMGALIGRYANRIARARFSLYGVVYPLYANDGRNHLHGGRRGFDKRIWQVTELNEHSVELHLVSGDGEEGYPGCFNVWVLYNLTDTALEIEYLYVCDKITPCSLTNHAYFNLAGHDSGPVDGQYIQIPSQFYTPTDAESIPTGEVLSVAGTPMDLRAGVPIGAHIDDDFPQLRMAGGYDHNWVVPSPKMTIRQCARAWSTESGILMDVSTSMPGVQFYTGNYLDGCPAGKGGAPYGKRWGFCLETQSFPNTPNIDHFPSSWMRDGVEYRSKTVYRFGLIDADDGGSNG